MRRKLLITGACGHSFIGRHLLEKLSQDKYEIFAPSSMQLDLCELESVKRYIGENGIQAVIHAAIHNCERNSPDRVLDADLRMYFNLKTMSGELEKLIHFGSGAEYDKRFEMNGITEDEIGVHIPQDPYGFAKYIINADTRASTNIYNLRLFGIFGKYERFERTLISTLCCRAMYGLPLQIRRNCMFDYMYIDDLPPIVELFLDGTPCHKDYNVCSGQGIALTDIMHIVNDVSGKALPESVVQDGLNNAYIGGSMRMDREFCPKRMDIRNAIERLYEYYLTQKNRIPQSVVERL